MALESTRVARISSTDTEIHLKKNIEVTSQIASQIASLPTSDPWIVLRLDTQNDDWSNSQTFNSFIDADNEFIQRAQNEGITDVERLRPDTPDNREITE